MLREITITSQQICGNFQQSLLKYLTQYLAITRPYAGFLPAQPVTELLFVSAASLEEHTST